MEFNSRVPTLDMNGKEKKQSIIKGSF